MKFKKIVTFYIPICWWLFMGILATRFFLNPEPIEIYNPVQKWMIWKVLAYSIGLLASGAIIFTIFNSLYLIFFQKDTIKKEIFVYTVLYLILMVSLVFTKQATDPLYVGDELGIYLKALNLYPFQFILTSQIYIICFFIFPVSISPLLIKVIFHAFVVGYIVGRTRIYYKTKWAYLLFGIFMLKPVLSESMRIHRMQWYALLYVLVAVKLYYDSKEKKNVRFQAVLFMCFLVALLTIWRREGLYLLVLGLLEILFVYGTRINYKQIILSFFTIELLFFTPTLVYENQSGPSEAIRTWEAWAVHMCSVDKLDREKNNVALSKIGQRLSIEIVDRYNSETGVERYNDCYWAWTTYKDGRYYALLEGNTEEKERIFKQGVIELAFKNPLVFYKSRVNAWNAVAAKNDISNLYIPLLISVAIGFYGLKKRKYLLAGIFVGVLCHCAITITTMPASYFKYFYEMYLMAYVFGTILIVEENSSNS